MTTIKTSRLVLRPIVESDLDAIFEYASNPNVGPNAGWEPHKTKDETRELMQMLFLNQESVWGITLLGEDKVLGTLGLLEDPKRQYDRVRMLGYSLDEGYWGKGYMTEACQAVIEHGFEKMQLDLISIYCFPFNAASKRVIEKCGFKYEGNLRKAEKIFDGNLYDNLCFSMDSIEYAEWKRC